MASWYKSRFRNHKSYAILPCDAFGKELWTQLMGAQWWVQPTDRQVRISFVLNCYVKSWSKMTCLLFLACQEKKNTNTKVLPLNLERYLTQSWKDIACKWKMEIERLLLIISNETPRYVSNVTYWCYIRSHNFLGNQIDDDFTES